MKKIFEKPAIQLVNAEAANMICSSDVKIGSGSAGDAINNGWTLNAKQGGIGTMSRIAAAEMGKLDF